MTTRPHLLGRVNLPGIAVVVMVVLGWHLIVATGLIDLEYLPGPFEVVKAGVEEAHAGVLAQALTATLAAAAVAGLFAAALGLVLGAAIAMMRPVAALLSASVDFLRSVPAVSLMPVLLLLLGPSASAEIIVTVFAGVWPMLLSTAAGVAQVPERLHEVGRVLHLSRRERVTKIYIPSALPSVLVGLRLSVVTCLVVVVIAEMLINPVGVGWELVRAQQALRPDILFAYAVLTGLVGYLLNVLLTNSARLVMPGSPVLRRTR